MGNVCLPVAHQFLSGELQEWIPGVPQASSPMCSCTSPACRETLQLLLPATAVTVCSEIWCWSLLGTSSAFLLKTAVLVLIHISWIPYCHIPSEMLMELQSCLERWQRVCHSHSRNSLSCAGLSDVKSYIPMIYELPLRSCSQPAGCPGLSLWQGHVVVVSSASFNDKL